MFGDSGLLPFPADRERQQAFSDSELLPFPADREGQRGSPTLSPFPLHRQRMATGAHRLSVHIFQNRWILELLQFALIRLIIGPLLRSSLGEPAGATWATVGSSGSSGLRARAWGALRTRLEKMLAETPKVDCLLLWRFLFVNIYLIKDR